MKNSEITFKITVEQIVAIRAALIKSSGLLKFAAGEQGRKWGNADPVREMLQNQAAENETILKDTPIAKLPINLI